MTGWYVSEAENCEGTRTQERGTWSRDGVLSADREEPGEGDWAWKMAPPGCVLNLSFIISQSGEFAELNQNPGVGRGTGQESLRRKTGNPEIAGVLAELHQHLQGIGRGN